MKKNSEIIATMKNTFERAGCKLTEDQEAVFAGCMHIWLDHVKDSQKEITSASLLCYIVDHSEMIPEEECQRIGVKFFKSDYNK